MPRENVSRLGTGNYIVVAFQKALVSLLLWRTGMVNRSGNRTWVRKSLSKGHKAVSHIRSHASIPKPKTIISQSRVNATGSPSLSADNALLPPMTGLHVIQGTVLLQLHRRGRIRHSPWQQGHGTCGRLVLGVEGEPRFTCSDSRTQPQCHNGHSSAIRQNSNCRSQRYGRRLPFSNTQPLLRGN